MDGLNAWKLALEESLKGKNPDELKTAHVAGFTLDLLYSDQPESTIRVVASQETALFAPIKHGVNQDILRLAVERSFAGFYPSESVDIELPLPCINTSDPIAQLPDAAADVGPNADAYRLHRLGASDMTELAYVVALSAASVRTRGKMPARCFVSVGSRLFDNIAKLRALRHLLLTVQEATGAENIPRIHALTSESMLCLQDPWNNVLRVMVGAAGALIGESDELTVFPHDWRSGVTDTGMRMACNVPVILTNEGWLDGRVQDAAGGSGFVEELTQKFSERGWSIALELDEVGLETAEGQQKLKTMVELDRASYLNRKDRVVGVTDFVVDEVAVPHDEPFVYADDRGGEHV